MKNNKNKKLSTALLIALVGFPQISETIYTPALPNVASGLHASVYMVEATLAIYFLGFAFGVLLWGAVSDWSGRRNAMLVGIMIYGVGTFGCGNAESINALLLWRLIQAFGASVGSIITQTILRDSYEGAERTKLFSVMSAALAFSPAIGPVLGGIISEFWGWRANFWTLTGIAIAIIIWTFLLLPETRPLHIRKVPLTRMYHLFFEMTSSCQLWGHIFLIGATNAILFGFYQEAPFIFIDQLGMSPSFYGFFGLLIAASTVFAARISYRQSGSSYFAKNIIQYGAGCVLTGGILFAIIVKMGIFSLGATGIAITTLVLFIIFFGIGLIIPNSLSSALRPYREAVGTAGSIFGGSYYCFIAIATWVMSVMHNGTALPLPIYIMVLGLVIVVGSQMVKYQALMKIEVE